MMKAFISSAVLCLIVGVQGMKAQDHSVTILDGPVMHADSLSSKPRPSIFLPVPTFQPFPRQNLLFAPYGMETKEQRAARINAQVYSDVMESVDRYLVWYRPPKLSRPWKITFSAARLFLSNPFGFPDGYVPLMNHSFPFIYAKTPGMAPYEYQYSPDKFPQCIKTEFDFATGTYKQVMVNDGFDFSKGMNGNINNSPVPKVPLNSIERHMF